MSILDVDFEAIGESQNCSSAPSTLQVDNVEHFTLADFENYCNPTETNTKEKPELMNRNSDETTDLLNSQDLPTEKLDGELNVNQELWLGTDSQNTNNEELDNTLDLSPNLYSNNEQQQVPIQMNNEVQHYMSIKDSNSASMESPMKISWTNIPVQDPSARSSENMFTKSNHFPNLHGTVNTSVLENARPISSTWSDTTNDQEVTNYLAEVVTVPQAYSQAQPNHFRVELGNDGQQYMIMDGKYFSENAQDMSAFQVGSNQYYFTGTQLQAEYPNMSHSAQSTLTNSASTSTQNFINQMGAFQNYNEDETEVIDKEVLEEQKRKEQMQIRRREKNKDCSRAFRRNQKEKERKLREGRLEKQARLKDLNRKNDNFIRMLSKAALQGCEKAKGIAATSMESWNKENKSVGTLSANM